MDYRNVMSYKALHGFWGMQTLTIMLTQKTEPIKFILIFIFNISFRKYYDYVLRNLIYCGLEKS